MNAKTYVIRIPGGYLRGLTDYPSPVPIELGQIFAESVPHDLSVYTVHEALKQARWNWPPAEVWAVEVTIAAVNGHQPCFALGDQP